jgi:plasmid stabilization system protein ParE
MVKITWTELAIEDLKISHAYILKDSKIYADRMAEKIIARVDQLAYFPKSGRVVPEFENDSIRELIQGNYRIIYKVSTQKISIIRIHHSAKLVK